MCGQTLVRRSPKSALAQLMEVNEAHKLSSTGHGVVDVDVDVDVVVDVVHVSHSTGQMIRYNPPTSSSEQDEESLPHVAPSASLLQSSTVVVVVIVEVDVIADVDVEVDVVVVIIVVEVDVVVLVEVGVVVTQNARQCPGQRDLKMSSGSVQSADEQKSKSSTPLHDG